MKSNIQIKENFWKVRKLLQIMLKVETVRKCIDEIFVMSLRSLFNIFHINLIFFSIKYLLVEPNTLIINFIFCVPYISVSNS